MRIFLAALLLGLLTSACGDSAMAPEPTIPDGEYLVRYVNGDAEQQLLFRSGGIWTVHDLYTGEKNREGEWHMSGNVICFGYPDPTLPPSVGFPFDCRPLGEDMRSLNDPQEILYPNVRNWYWTDGAFPNL